MGSGRPVSDDLDGVSHLSNMGLFRPKFQRGHATMIFVPGANGSTLWIYRPRRIET
jgi:hypothetical protein